MKIIIRMNIKILIFFVFIGSAQVASSDTILIPEHYSTISEGIAAASEGDTVLVSPGTYNEQIDFMGKNITVASLYMMTHNPTYIKETIITHTNFILVGFSGGETRSATLNGFTLNGHVAIFCNNSSPTLKNLNISDGRANFLGAGLLCEDSSNPLIINCTFTNNELVEPTVHGGAIFAEGNSHPVLVNSIVWNNTHPQISLGYRDLREPGSITIAYSNIEGGEHAIEINDGSIYWLDGNIDADPLFKDPQSQIYTLQDGSPCIDSGTASLIMDNDTLVALDTTQYRGTSPNMGAFQYEIPTNVKDQVGQVPDLYMLFQNYPNPFNPSTSIRYNIPERNHVLLTVYNTLGQEVAKLIDQEIEPGTHEITFDASHLPSGVYIYRLQAGEYVESRKLLLLK